MQQREIERLASGILYYIQGRKVAREDAILEIYGESEGVHEALQFLVRTRKARPLVPEGVDPMRASSDQVYYIKSDPARMGLNR